MRPGSFVLASKTGMIADARVYDLGISDNLEYYAPLLSSK